MTQTDLQLETFFKDTVAARALRKDEETITSFNRDIFWYNKDELERQADYSETHTLGNFNYEDHRKAVEIAVNMMRKETQHDIAMCILTDRFFKDYRAKVFAGEGSFNTDYSFLVTKVGHLFNATKGRVNNTNTIQSSLKSYSEPTLVQINHIAGIVTKVTPPSDKLTLNEWAIKYNESANQSTSYRITGLKVG